MGRRAKLLARIFARPTPSDLTFAELSSTFEHYGGVVTPPTGGGSHYTFAVPGLPAETVPRHDPVKAQYVRNVRDLLAAAGVTP